mgnify:CR=1 FL=1
MNVIELKGITKSYGEGNSRVEVLRDVNLSIRQGDFVAIIGQSGSGKSTLMNILGCRIRQGSGKPRSGRAGRAAQRKIRFRVPAL